MQLLAGHVSCSESTSMWMSQFAYSPLLRQCDQFQCTSHGRVECLFENELAEDVSFWGCTLTEFRTFLS